MLPTDIYDQISLETDLFTQLPDHLDEDVASCILKVTENSVEWIDELNLENYLDFDFKIVFFKKQSYINLDSFLENFSVLNDIIYIHNGDFFFDAFTKQKVRNIKELVFLLKQVVSLTSEKWFLFDIDQINNDNQVFPTTLTNIFTNNDMLTNFDLKTKFILIFKLVNSIKTTGVNYTNSTIEMSMVVKILFFLNNLYLSTKDPDYGKILWPYLNLPPGSGKSFQNMLLLKQYRAQVVCPTAFATLQYESTANSGRAQTLHKFFKIFQTKINNYTEVYKINCDDEYSKNNELIIFDECCMVAEKLLIEVLKFIKHNNRESFKQGKNIFCVLTGDSAQLPPVKGRVFSFEDYKYNGSVNHFNICKFEMNYKNKYVVLPRFGFNTNMKCFVMSLKKIVDERLSKTLKLDVNSVDFLRKGFEMFNVQKERISRESVVANIETNVLKNLKILQDSKDYLAEFDSFMGMDKFKEMGICSIPIVIGYMNSYCVNIQQKILESMQIEFDKLDFLCSQDQTLPKECLFDSHDDFISAFYSNMSCVFVEPQNVENDYIALGKLLKDLPGSVSNNKNVIRPGIQVLCRRNDGESVYNGLSGTVVSIKTNLKKNDLFEKNIYDSVDKRKTAGDNDNSCAFTVVNNLNKFDLRIFVYNEKKNQIFEGKLRSVFLCENCEKGRCPHHPYVRKNAPVVKVLYWHSCFALTIYNLQGVTIFDDQVCCETDAVLFRQIPQCVHVITSRMSKPKNLCIDNDFIEKTINSLYENKHVYSDVKLDKVYKKIKKC